MSRWYKARPWAMSVRQRVPGGRVYVQILRCFERRGMIQNATGEGRGFISEGEAARPWALRPGQGSET